jgi:hypothetical protein
MSHIRNVTDNGHATNECQKPTTDSGKTSQNSPVSSHDDETVLLRDSFNSALSLSGSSVGGWQAVPVQK